MRITAALPAVDVPFGLSTPISSLPRDRVTRAAFWAAVRSLIPDAPDDLIDSIETLGEAYDWPASRTATGAAGHLASRVRLRPVRDGDLTSLFLASSSFESGYRWRYRGATPSPQEFQAQLHEGVLAQFVVEGLDGVGLGLVVAYDARMEQGSASIGLVRTAPGPGRGEVLEGLIRFIDFLFDVWPFRKLYAEVPEFNAVDLLDPTMDVLSVEGRLIGHCFAEGGWWDQLILAIWRDAWFADRGRWPFLPERPDKPRVP